MNEDSSNAQLIVQEGHEVVLAFEETSFFHQLSEVCENAQIYVSAKADLALTTRSQHLDRLLQLNQLQPTFFSLDKRQQLAIGNQVTQYLLARLGTWDNLDAIVEGRLLMRDLPANQRLTERSLQLLLNGEKASEVLAHTVAHEAPQQQDGEHEIDNVERAPGHIGEQVIKHIEWEQA